MLLVSLETGAEEISATEDWPAGRVLGRTVA
jgi:hypothetical protein